MKTRIAVALAAIAVVAAGCAPATTAGSPVAPVDAAEATTALEREPAPAAVYRDVTGEAERFDLSADPTQWATVPLPGSLLIPQPNDGEWACTVGPAVAPAPGAGTHSRLGFLSAGHCGDGSGTMTGIFTDAHAENDLYLGILNPAVNVGDRDHGVIWTYDLPTPADATRIAGRGVSGVMREAAVRRLEPGTAVCISGSRAGVRCGPLVRADSLIAFTLDPQPEGGDSGAPVYVVDEGGNALVIGLLEGTLRGSGAAAATYLEPALRDLDARVLTEPGARAADPQLLAPGLAVSR